MAYDVRSSRYDSMNFSFTRNGIKIFLFGNYGFYDEDLLGEEFELIQSPDRYDEILREVTFGPEC